MCVCSVGQAAAIHAVIIDLQGTRISAALEFSSSIRKERHLERLSIVGLSTGLCTSAEKELKEAGFLSIVNKPLRVAALVAALLQPVGVSEVDEWQEASCGTSFFLSLAFSVSFLVPLKYVS